MYAWSVYAEKHKENTWFLYDFRYLKALILKLIQSMFRSIFPMSSEGRLSIDFGRILRAMGEDYEQENFLKPYEQIHIIFDVLFSKYRGRKRKNDRRGAGQKPEAAADADTP